MEQKKLSGGQFGILTFVMMMAPIVHAVPTRIIDARRASWLLPLAAVLPLSILMFFLFRCLSRMPADSGLGDVYHLAFGSRWGKVCCGLSAMWMVMIMVVDLRFYAERYVSAVYPEAGKLVFYLAMAVLQLWIVREDLNCLLRAGKVFFWVVTLTLAAVLLLAIGKIRLYNLWPVTDTSWREVGLGTIRLSTAISMAVPAGFLLGKVQWKTRKSGAVWWVIALTGATMGIAVSILGVFGPELSQRLQVPFFTLAKEVSVTGAMERLESIISAMWMMTDTALMGVLAFSAEQALRQVAGETKRPEWVRRILILVLVAACCALPKSAFDMDAGYQAIGMPLNIIIGYLIPGAALIVAKVRKRW